MPYYPKTDYERTFLQKALQNHYLFESQSNTSIQKLIDAFEICTIDLQDPNTVPVHDDHTNTTEYHVPIIHQGEEVIAQPTNTQHPISNAYFYVVYYGTCSFIVDDTMVGFAYPGDAFGELALLYNGPRAATVTAILKEQDDIIKTHQVVMRKDDDNNDDGIDPHAAARLSSNAVSLSTMSDIASISDMELGSNPNAHNNNTDGMMMTDPTGISNDVPPTFPDYTVVLFRVHQRSFRIILQQDDQESNHVTMNLLNNIEFLQNVPLSVRENLAQVLVPVPFNAGDHILPKGTLDCPWYVIERGTVRATNLEHGYQDFCFTEGQCFGERAIMANAPAIADVYAETAGVAFTVDGNTFKALIGNVLGSDTNIISRQQDISRLKGIRILSSATQTDDRVLNYLSKQITDQTFPVGAVICRANEPLVHLPSLYLIRTGTIRLDYVDKVDPIYLGMDAYFGEDQLQADMSGRDRKGLYISPYTATVIEECTCGTLRLRDCRNVIDTRRMGEEGNVLEFDSLSLTREIDKGIQMNQLTVHRMIGAGTFGQVHLVSRTASDGTERVYALKVQSKYELCQSGQAKGVVREKNIMKMFHHPFVAKLLSAFQDEKCVYMVMNLLQGGELYSIMHTKKSNVLPEQSAKFYIACVAEALFYLHCSHSLVFRDLKPENVMIDNDGYAILIDFGFCKKISGKTYTTCGTPLYLAPEVILNRGHSWSVDYWSLGIMIYEMLVGHTPFYEHGMNKAELFQNIVRGKVYPPTNVSPEVLSLLSGLLRRDPAKRLGSLIGNENDIIEHPWFSDIDRDRLFLKELDAPIIPKIKDPFDSSNFSSWKHVDDKRFVRYPALSPDDELIFKDF
jgi:protein kinase A